MIVHIHDPTKVSNYDEVEEFYAEHKSVRIFKSL